MAGSTQLARNLTGYFATHQSQNVQFFDKNVTLTSAAAADGVTILSATEIGEGRSAYIQGFSVQVSSTTAWTDSTATDVRIRDAGGTPITFATIAKAQITSGAILTLGSTGVTLGAGFLLNSGGAAATAIVALGTASGTAANFAAGSDLKIRVWGYIK